MERRVGISLLLLDYTANQNSGSTVGQLAQQETDMTDNSESKHPAEASFLKSVPTVTPLNQTTPDEILQEAIQHAKVCNWDAAISACRRLIALIPDPVQVHDLMAGIMLPGEDYLSLMRRIHEHLRPRTYVEIGVEHGDSLTLVREGTLALGVDPAPQIIHSLQPTTKVFAETSDDFFVKRNLSIELAGQPIDLAFIDGMHQFEFALRDFINIERYCTPGSTILIHDCYPLDAVTAARKRTTSFWSGDIWKLTLCLKEYRPDLAVYTIATPPTGLGLVRNLDPHSTVLRDNLQRIYDEFIPLPYETIVKQKPQFLNIFPNAWPQVQALFE